MYAPAFKCVWCGGRHWSQSEVAACADEKAAKLMKETPHREKVVAREAGSG